MAKKELFESNPLFKFIIKFFGAFPVERGKGDTEIIDTSLSKLEMGRNLLVFPEGTRSKDGKVGKGKSGVAVIAAAAQVPVIPVGISFKGSKLKFRSKVTVRYGKPIDLKQMGICDASPQNIKILKHKIMQDITELVD